MELNLAALNLVQLCKCRGCSRGLQTPLAVLHVYGGARQPEPAEGLLLEALNTSSAAASVAQSSSCAVTPSSVL